MKKIKFYLLLVLSVLFISCTNTGGLDIVNGGLSTFSSALKNINKTLSSITGSDYAEGNHYFYIKLPETKYYSASELELHTYYESYGGGIYDVDINIKGNIMSKINAPLIAKVYVPVYNADGNILKKYTREFISQPYDAIVVDFWNKFNSKRKAYVLKDNIIIGVYYKGHLVGSNNSELLKQAKSTYSKKIRKVKKVRQNTKKIKVKRKRQSM